MKWLALILLATNLFVVAVHAGYLDASGLLAFLHMRDEAVGIRDRSGTGGAAEDAALAETDVSDEGGSFALRLLAEVPAGQLRERDNPAGKGDSSETASGGVATEDGAVIAGGDRCATVGPFQVDGEAAPIKVWLAELGLRAELRSDERREISMYWVHLPPAKDRTTAEKMVREMKASGLDDLYLIPGGDMANAISLGVFRQRTSMERRLAQLKRSGYDAATTPRYKIQSASWLDVRGTPPNKLEELGFSRAFPDAGVVARPCQEGEIAG